MKQTAERNLSVKYFEKEGDQNTWIVESHMIEEQHDIIVNLEINMEQMQIVNANIEFNRYPLNECKLIEKVANRLVGLKVDHSFPQKALKITMGPEGCPNVMTLLSISVPGVMYYYYTYKIRTGEITRDQFFDILKTNEKNACLAHTMMFAETK
jgi:Protein of unknown function (DUF2889).